MDDERLGVADVGQVAASSTDSMNVRPGVAAAAHPEGEHRAGPDRQVARRPRRGAGWSARPAQFTHATRGSSLQPLGDGAGVGDVRVHALRQRLDALQQQEGRVRAQRGADVAQLLAAELGEEGVLAEVLPPLQPAVGRRPAR